MSFPRAFRPAAKIGVPFFLFAAALLSACSGTLEGTMDEYLPSKDRQYKSSRSLPPLEVPPDLSSTAINDSFSVPGSPASGSATYSEYASGGNRTASIGETVLPQPENVRIERSSDERWLVVDAPPAQVWPRVRDFWLSQGFLLKTEDPAVGIMETDWAEERQQFKGGLFNFMRKFSSALYGVGTRVKFRTRLERGAAPGTTEIFISHRRAEEVAPEDRTRPVGFADEPSKVWKLQPPDPGLEAEMLHRMLVALGVEEQQARQLIAEAPERPDRARLVQTEDGSSMLALQENFSRAWRRTGLALDRVGFTVEDRDRSRGLYYVRYVDPDLGGGGEKGFFSSLKFWGDDQTERRDEYLVSLVGDSNGDDTTEVTILNEQGEPEKSEIANRILSLLHEQLK